MLKGYRILDAIVKVHDETTLDDVENAIFESAVYRPAIIAANKADTPDAAKNLRELEQFVGNQLTVIPTSCRTGYGLEKLGAEIFKALEIIRVYTKEPNEKESFSQQKVGSTFILEDRDIVKLHVKQR